MEGEGKGNMVYGESPSYSQSKTNNAISCVEEANISRINTALGWNPRQDEKVDVYGHSEDKDHVPCDELPTRSSDGLSSLSNEPETEGQEEGEHVRGVGLDVNNYYNDDENAEANRSVRVASMMQCNEVNVLKLNASPAGGARMTITVRTHLRRYGPRGVLNGRVEAQKRG